VRRAALATAAAALLVALPPLVQAGPGAGPRLTIFAASSLTEVFPRIDRRPAYSFGGSNQLALQIRQGAPADVFASASPTYTQSLYREGRVERPATFASNSLVLAVPRANPAGLRSVYDLRRKDVRLVIGTSAVPIGSYTRKVLRNLGLASVLSKVVSEEPDVKSIVGKVALGEADAGFVYRTDVRAAGGRIRAIAIPPRGQPTVRYQLAVVKSGRNRAAARAWVRMIRTNARAGRLLRQAGFGLP
jgi:molybdate transport system substrate-binding protein